MKNKESDFEKTSAAELLKDISNKDFRELGTGYIAYIKSSVATQSFYSLHMADGEVLSIDDNLPSVITAAKDQDLHLVTLH